MTQSDQRGADGPSPEYRAAVGQKTVTREILQGLMEVGAAVADTERDLSDRLENLLLVIQRLLGCDRCSVVLWDGEAYRIERTIGCPEDLIEQAKALRWAHDEAIFVAARNGENGLFVANDALANPVIAGPARSARIQAIIVASMSDADGRPVGFITTEYNERVGEFDEVDAEIITAAALLAGGAVLTDRERRQQAVADRQRDIMLERLANAEERERRRIGAHLNDDVLQRVASLSHFLEIAAAEAAADGDMTTSQQLERLEFEARASAIELRRLVTDLVPASSTGTTLRSVLDGVVLAADSRSEVLVTLKETSAGDTAVEIRSALHRIALQAIDNALLHAQPSAVEVICDVDNDRARVQVFDDGVGFSVSDVRQGIGLFSMSERARHLGGECVIQSSRGEGTVIDVWIPHEPELHGLLD